MGSTAAAVLKVVVGLAIAGVILPVLFYVAPGFVDPTMAIAVAATSVVLVFLATRPGAGL